MEQWRYSYWGPQIISYSVGRLETPRRSKDAATRTAPEVRAAEKHKFVIGGKKRCNTKQ